MANYELFLLVLLGRPQTGWVVKNNSWYQTMVSNFI